MVSCPNKGCGKDLIEVARMISEEDLQVVHTYQCGNCEEFFYKKWKIKEIKN